MVVLNRIYTRTGDDGTTSLGSGARRKKYDLRVDAYGTVDEVNAVLGLVNMMRGGSPNRSQKLMRLRVVLQFIAIIVIMLTIWAMGR